MILFGYVIWIYICTGLAINVLTTGIVECKVDKRSGKIVILSGLWAWFICVVFPYLAYTVGI